MLDVGKEVTTHLINASARSNSSLSGTFQESFQRSVRNEQPTCGNFCRSSVGCLDCVVVNLIPQRIQGRLRRSPLSHRLAAMLGNSSPQELNISSIIGRVA